MSSATEQPQQISRFGQAFIAYGCYHYDTVQAMSESLSNKIIHIICIPLITMSLFSLLSYVPYSFTYEDANFGKVTIGAPELLAISVIIYYISLNLVFGVLAAIGTYGLSVVWMRTFKDYSQEEHFKAMAILQAVAWGLQFVGHGVFQKRKPALVDNLLQIFNAPLFVLMELCEMVGFTTKELDLWKSEIKRNVFEYRASLKKHEK